MKALSTLLVCAVGLLASACSSTVHGNGGDGGARSEAGTLGADGKHPTGGQCTGATQESAATCEGAICISLKPNVQSKPGICSQECTGTCPGGICASFDTSGKAYCFRKCVTDAECIDGFVCVGDTPDQKVCLVQPTGGAASDGGTVTADGGAGGDRCAAAGCPTLTMAAADINSYCPSAPSTTRVCDCPGAGPAAPCSAATQGANLYCCP